MDNIKVETPPPATTTSDQKTPLLAAAAGGDTQTSSKMRQAISSVFKGTAYLVSRLPTGTVLAFQLLSPVLSNHGACDSATRAMTAALVALCGLSCFVLSFTDSYKDAKGNVYYGFATFSGFYAIDRNTEIPPEECEKRRLGFLDFLHAFLALLVFATISLLDRNIVNCFYPSPSVEMQEIISALPIANGVVCSILFVVFPTRRNGFDMGAPA